MAFRLTVVLLCLCALLPAVGAFSADQETVLAQYHKMVYERQLLLAKSTGKMALNATSSETVLNIYYAKGGCGTADAQQISSFGSGSCLVNGAGSLRWTCSGENLFSIFLFDRKL
jgi:hypothetical protein